MLLKKVRMLSRDFEITIVTLDNENLYFPNDDELAEFIPENVKVVSVPIFKGRNIVHKFMDLVFRTVFRGSLLVKYFDLVWALNAIKRIKKSILPAQHFDILITNSHNYISHLVGYCINKELQAPWIQHYSDPGTLSPFAISKYNIIIIHNSR